MIKNKLLVVDFRMYNSSGIGVYISSLAEFFALEKPSFLYKLVQKGPQIYSIAEQLFFLKFFARNIFWSPHYNIPLILFSGKRLVTIHDVYHLAFYDTLSLKQKLYAKIMLSVAVRKSNKIITVSHFSKEEIIKYTRCKPDKITVIHNGCRQLTVHKSFTIIKQKYQLPEKYILFVGNVKPHKNLRKLILAYKLLDENIRRKYAIVIVGKKEGFITGDASLMKDIEDDPELRRAVRFTGFVEEDDLDTIYKNASLFVFPSYYEGFGLPPLEAMLNECPVLSSNAASMPEVCGDAALYFDPANEKELAEKIIKILEDDMVRNELVLKGKNRLKMFTWEKSAREHIKLIDSMMR